MPGFDGNGVFTRNYSWQVHADSGIGIEPGYHDTEDDEFMRGMNKAFCRDGQASATGDFDMDSHLIHNIGLATQDGDVVSLGQVTGSGGNPALVYKKGPEIVGADSNGRLNFTAATGVNGIGWLGADLSWLAKLFKTGETRNRLVLNNAYNPTPAAPGSDVVILDDAGNVQVTSLTANLSLDSANQWRTIAPGWGFRALVGSTGMTLYNITTATLTDPYMPAALEQRMSFATAGGSATINLFKDSEGNNKACSFVGYRDASPRWLIYMGGPDAETANKGSSWYLYRYNDAGTPFNVITIPRDTGDVTFNSGRVYCNTFESIGAVAGVFGGTGVYLRPNSSTSTAGQVFITTGGYCQLGNGIYTKVGSSGGYGGQIYNSYYAAANDLRWYIGDSLVGYYTPACDHRLKRDIRPLPSTWDAVKNLKPVIYKDAAFGEPGELNMYRDGDEDRVGFLACDLQDALGRHAATGEKDGADIQGPDVMAVVAAVTCALQEAMTRIEALEGAA